MDDVLTQLTNWSEPWLWVSLAAVLCAFALIGFLPLASERELATTHVEQVLMHLRRALLLAFLLLALGFPVILWSLAANVSGSAATASKVVHIVVFQQAWRMWGLLAGALLGGLVLKVIFLRCVQPRFSSWFIFRRVSQRGDFVSDIRAEANRFRERNFQPDKHYQAGQVFLGLKENGSPLRVKVGDWKAWNQRIVGPTQTGKGVFFGVQLDQSMSPRFLHGFFRPQAGPARLRHHAPGLRRDRSAAGDGGFQRRIAREVVAFQDWHGTGDKDPPDAGLRPG